MAGKLSVSDDEDKKMNIQDILNQEKTNSKIHQLTEAQVNYKISNKENWNDPEYREKMRLAQSDPNYKKRASEQAKTRWQDNEFKKKREQSLNAWAKSDKRRQQVSEQFKNKPKSQTHKENMAKSQQEFYKTPAGKKALRSKSLKQKGVKRPIVTCPHCNKQGADRIMGRWHFDNCKHKKV